MDKGQKKGQKKDTHFSQSRNSWVSYSPFFPVEKFMGEIYGCPIFLPPIFRFLFSASLLFSSLEIYGCPILPHDRLLAYRSVFYTVWPVRKLI